MLLGEHLENCCASFGGVVDSFSFFYDFPTKIQGYTNIPTNELPPKRQKLFLSIIKNLVELKEDLEEYSKFLKKYERQPSELRHDYYFSSKEVPQKLFLEQGITVKPVRKTVIILQATSVMARVMAKTI